MIVRLLGIIHKSKKGTPLKEVQFFRFWGRLEIIILKGYRKGRGELF